MTHVFNPAMQFYGAEISHRICRRRDAHSSFLISHNSIVGAAASVVKEKNQSSLFLEPFELYTHHGTCIVSVLNRSYVRKVWNGIGRSARDLRNSPDAGPFRLTPKRIPAQIAGARHCTVLSHHVPFTHFPYAHYPMTSRPISSWRSPSSRR
jgi:hypothetical protein